MTDVVHKQGSFIYGQLWALGRTALLQELEKEGFEYVGASDIPITGKPRPRPITVAGKLKPSTPLFGRLIMTYTRN